MVRSVRAAVGRGAPPAGGDRAVALGARHPSRSRGTGRRRAGRADSGSAAAGVDSREGGRSGMGRPSSISSGRREGRTRTPREPRSPAVFLALLPSPGGQGGCAGRGAGGEGLGAGRPLRYASPPCPRPGPQREENELAASERPKPPQRPCYGLRCGAAAWQASSFGAR